MIIKVRVKTKSRESKVEKINDLEYIVSVKGLPVEGKANEEVIEALAKHFHKAKSCVEIVHGRKSKNKIIKIN